MRFVLSTVLVLAAAARAALAADWWDEWQYQGEMYDHHNWFAVVDVNGRQHVHRTHPESQAVPFKWTRTVTVGAGSSNLHVEVSSDATNEIKDFLFKVVVNGQVLVEEVIVGAPWHTYDVSLAAFSGQTVNIELWDADSGNWWYELAYWDKVRIAPVRRLTADRIASASFGADSATGGGQASQGRGKPSPREARGTADAAPPRKERKEPSAETLAAWDAKLAARVREELAAGRRLTFHYARQRATVVSMDVSGKIEVSVGRVRLPVAWAKLTLEDRKSLALAALREDVPEDRALAGFYLLAVGRDDDAEDQLRRAGALAADVRATFER